MKRMIFLSSALCMLAPSALLADMRYNTFDASFVDVEIDGGPANVDGDGIELGGSYELNDKFFLFGRWQDQDLDFGIDGRLLEIGAGLHHPLSATMDFVGTLSYLDTELNAGNLSADDSGLTVGGGIRARVADAVEIDASLKLIDFDDSGSDTGVTLGGRYYFSEKMAVGVGIDLSDNADTLRIGFRGEF
jgi:opacity protein-like surface antigen